MIDHLLFNTRLGERLLTWLETKYNLALTHDNTGWRLVPLTLLNNVKINLPH